MKRLLIILTILISGVVSAQGSPPTDTDPEVVFEFECAPHVTDGIVGDFRTPLLLALGNINITIHFYENPANTENGAHDHITIKDNYNNVHTSFYLSGIKLEDNYDYRETQVKNLTPENFKKLYIDIENIITNL